MEILYWIIGMFTFLAFATAGVLIFLRRSEDNKEVDPDLISEQSILMCGFERIGNRGVYRFKSIELKKSLTLIRGEDNAYSVYFFNGEAFKRLPSIKQQVEFDESIPVFIQKMEIEGC